MQHVLVAGATGYLGRYVTRRFKEEGYRVRVLARNPEKLKHEGPYMEPSVFEYADEVFAGEITRPETLAGVCDGIDIVFSSVGITRQRDKMTYDDVDYRGNLNLLNEARRSSSVSRFLFVSVFQASKLEHLDIVKARERFARELAGSGLAYTIIRPTGFFSDMTELLRMAKSGAIWLIGTGEHRLNPIHGADLADVCVRAASGDTREIAVGGPDAYTHRELASLAFRTIGQPTRIIRLPVRAMKLALTLIRPFNKRLHGILSFFAASMTLDFVAPASGTHRLESYFNQYVGRESGQRS